MTIEENLNLREDVNNLIFLLELVTDSLLDREYNKANNLYKAFTKQIKQLGAALEREALLAKGAENEIR